MTLHRDLTEYVRELHAWTEQPPALRAATVAVIVTRLEELLEKYPDQLYPEYGYRDGDRIVFPEDMSEATPPLFVRWVTPPKELE